MKKFRFPLKSVAIVREARELRLREAFSVALQAVAVAEDMLDQVRRRKTELEHVLVAERRCSFRPAEQIAFLQAHQRVVEEESNAVSDLQKAVAVRETRRAEWLESRRDLRLIEKLEQTARQEHRRDEEREAQRTLDDRPHGPNGRGLTAAA